MKQIDLREGARRQHRALAMMGALQCWVRGLDGIIFSRFQLERLIGLDRFKQKRVDWLREDFEDLFPCLQVLETKKSVSHLLACRKPFQNRLGSLLKYREWCKSNDVAVADFSIWSLTGDVVEVRAIEGLGPFFGYCVNSDERLMTSYLSLIATGQMSVLDVPGIRPAP